MPMYLLPIFIGCSISIIGFFALFITGGISSNYLLSISIAGFAFAAATFLEEFLNLENKKDNKKIAIKACYFVAIFSLVALPTILENSKIGELLKSNSDSLAIESVGIVVFSIGIRELVKEHKKIKQLSNKTVSCKKIMVDPENGTNYLIDIEEGMAEKITVLLDEYGKPVVSQVKS